MWDVLKKINCGGVERLDEWLARGKTDARKVTF